MNSLISRLQRPGYDLQKEQAIQEVVVELRRLNAERDECNRRRLEAADHFAAQTTLMKKKYDELRTRLEAAEKSDAESLAMYRRARDERDALRAKIEAMERQVPICRAEDLKHAESLLPTLGLKPENHLYALPGAKGE